MGKHDGKRRRGWELCTWKKKEASQTRGGVQGRRGGRGWRVSGGLGKRSFKQRELVFSFVFVLLLLCFSISKERGYYETRVSIPDDGTVPDDSDDR